MDFSPDLPKQQPAPEPIVDTAVADEAAAAERRRAKAKKGVSANILTSPSGAKLGESGTTGTMQRGSKTLGAA